MKIVITGSEGYIGRMVSERISACADNHEVIGIDYDNRSRHSECSELICQDIKDVKGLQADVLIHLAALASVEEGEDKPQLYYSNNCAAYHQFLRNNKFNKVIYASSYAVYNDYAEIYPTMVYGDTKLIAEYITRRYTNNHTILRFANPVGVIPELHNTISHKLVGTGYSNVFFKIAEYMIKDEKFPIHNIPGMIRAFYPLKWIGEAIAHSMNDYNGTWNIASSKNTEVIMMIKGISSTWGLRTTLVDPPAGVTKGAVINTHLHPIIIGMNEEYDPWQYCLSEFRNYINLTKKHYHL